MRDLFDLYFHVDVISAALVAGIVYYIGGLTSREDVGTLRLSRRAGIATFVLFSMGAFTVYVPQLFEDVCTIFVRALLASGMVQGVLGLSLPGIKWTWRIIRVPGLAYRRWRNARRERVDAARRAHEDARNRQQADAEWERGRPQRERDAKAAEERRKAEERLRQDEQQRRENARATCEMLYARHAPEIDGRFTRAMLDDFLTRYMGDTRSADAVEERSRQLVELIEQHCQAIKPKEKVHTIDELARWFLAEKGRIEALDLDDEMKDEHLAHLQIRYSELSQEILEKVRP